MSILNRLFRTKSLDALVAETQEEGHQLKKALGPWNLVALGIGAIIGAGIFATIGTAAAGDAQRPGAGPALMLSFVLTAIVCGFSALCYAEFASMVPVAGSAYTYSYATLGELIAWIIGWDLIIEYAIGNVAVAISWANYFNTLIEGFGLKLPPWLAIDYTTAVAKMPDLVAHAPHVGPIPIVFNLFAVLIVAVITIVLVWGIRESANFNFVMVAIKLVVLGFFVLVSLKFVKPANWHPFAPNGIHGIFTGAAIVFFAYIGFDAVSTTAEEARNPKRDMPIGIIGSLIVCTAIYALIAAVFTGMIPFPILTKTLASQQAEPLTLAMKLNAMPNWMVGVVAFGSVVAHTAVLLVFQLGQPRIFFAMSRDGLLPKFFSKVHSRFKTPHVSTIITGVFVGGAAMVTSLDDMVDLTNIGTLFAFMLVCIGIMILRIKDPDRERSFRVPGGPFLLPILGALSCLGLAYYLPPRSWMRFVMWLCVGLIIYATYGLRAIVYRGRMQRLRYLLSCVAVILGEAVLLLLVKLWEVHAHQTDRPWFAYSTVIAAAIAANGIFTVRRLHDIDMSGYRYWWMWVPGVNALFFLMLLLKKGTGPNKYDFVGPASGRPEVPAVIPPDFNPEQQLPEPDVRGRH
jgi:basic amino acid/polyamine antiporter, APA family